MDTCEPSYSATSSLPHAPASVPGHVGVTDVIRIEAAAQAFRDWDHQHGGGACHDAIAGYLAWAQRLLDARTTDPVADRHRTAVADLHILAGWTAFDIGRVDRAHQHLGDALRLARLARDDVLVAAIGYRSGRIHLHHNGLDMALADFQSGQHAAQAGASTLAAAVLHANEAWVTARMGLTSDTLTALGKSMDDFGRSDPDDAPGWAVFFDTNDLLAMSGVIHTELAQSVDPSFARSAIPALTAAANGYGPKMARSKTFSLIALATSHLIENDTDHAAVVGAQAIDMAMTVRSSRTRDRLLPLRSTADHRRGSAGARELSERIAGFAAMSPGCGWAATPSERTCLSGNDSLCGTVWRPPATVD
ncbi:transcriptional regulator [Actinocrispum sp. NPDC049592]|uniref:transcriptional regulator n=1 Tax=Actinocrispum sp. NPDC049592 TaxID=3154835 RepID=UPI00343CE663